MNYKEEWLRPIWNTEEQYRETFLMVEENGCCKAPFLFRPEQILKVESYDGQIQYEEKKDYECRDGALWMTENSRIPHTGWGRFEYHTAEEAQTIMSQYPRVTLNWMPLMNYPISAGYTVGDYLNEKDVRVSNEEVVKIYRDFLKGMKDMHYSHYRILDINGDGVDDLLLNSAGFLMGYGVYLLFKRMKKAKA